MSAKGPMVSSFCHFEPCTLHTGLAHPLNILAENVLLLNMLFLHVAKTKALSGHSNFL